MEIIQAQECTSYTLSLLTLVILKHADLKQLVLAEPDLAASTANLNK